MEYRDQGTTPQGLPDNGEVSHSSGEQRFAEER
jgi:hypothetical protein